MSEEKTYKECQVISPFSLKGQIVPVQDSFLVPEDCINKLIDARCIILSSGVESIEVKDPVVDPVIDETKTGEQGEDGESDSVDEDSEEDDSEDNDE